MDLLEVLVLWLPFLFRAVGLRSYTSQRSEHCTRKCNENLFHPILLTVLDFDNSKSKVHFEFGLFIFAVEYFNLRFHDGVLRRQQIQCLKDSLDYY